MTKVKATRQAAQENAHIEALLKEQARIREFMESEEPTASDIRQEIIDLARPDIEYASEADVRDRIRDELKEELELRFQKQISQLERENEKLREAVEDRETDLDDLQADLNRALATVRSLRIARKPIALASKKG